MGRAVLALVAALLVVLLATPMLFAGGDPPPTCSATVPSSMAAVLATIRELESGGDYQARASGSSASGAYQFLDSTWDSYGGYPSAWLAPPEVQGAKATASVTAILDAHDGDVSAVPVVWYLGHLPADGSSEWDTVPAPSAGNALTPRVPVEVDGPLPAATREPRRKRTCTLDRTTCAAGIDANAPGGRRVRVKCSAMDGRCPDRVRCSARIRT